MADNKIIIENDIYELEMDFYYYNFENKIEDKWPLVRIFNYNTIKNTFYLNNLNKIRRLNINDKNKIKNSGWHLSYFGDINFIINKIKQYSHTEFNNEKYINKITMQELIKNRSIHLFDPLTSTPIIGTKSKVAKVIKKRKYE